MDPHFNSFRTHAKRCPCTSCWTASVCNRMLLIMTMLHSKIIHSVSNEQALKTMFKPWRTVQCRHDLTGDFNYAESCFFVRTRSRSFRTSGWSPTVGTHYGKMTLCRSASFPLPYPLLRVQIRTWRNRSRSWRSFTSSSRCPTVRWCRRHRWRRNRVGGLKNVTVSYTLWKIEILRFPSPYESHYSCENVRIRCMRRFHDGPKALQATPIYFVAPTDPQHQIVTGAGTLTQNGKKWLLHAGEW